MLRHFPSPTTRSLRAVLLLAALVAALAGNAALPGASTQAAGSALAGNTPTELFVTRGVQAPARQALSTGATRSLQVTEPVTPTVGLSNPAAQETPVPAPYTVSGGAFRYFPQTAHYLRGIFYSFWQSHGATPVFGLPITEAINEGGLVVQYLERARLEWHPDISPQPSGQVLLTRLGAISLEARGIGFPPLPSGQNTPSSYFFTETGHNLANGFLTYWQTHGGLAVFGYPLSEEIVETSPTDGKQYTVQYFERNRFEWHPENPTAYSVQLGLLGAEYARMVSLNPMARVLLASPVKTNDQDLSGSPQLADLVDPGLLPAVQTLGHTPQFRWVPALILQDNIPVQFSAIDQEGVAGALLATRSRIRPYVIAIPDTEKGESTEALASVVAHEATHAFDVTTGVTPTRLTCSIEEELRAYMNGLAAWVLLNGSGAMERVYPRSSLADAINSSVKGFNSDSPVITLDFDPQSGRDYLRTLYGSSCGR